MNTVLDVSYDFLSGRDESLLVPCWSGQMVHRDILEPLQTLKHEAARAGFVLGIASSYRSYARQRLIWKEKLAGQRPLLDADERPLDVSMLTDEQALWALLRWSAIPGASRHHWGTDLDVYDVRALERQGLKLQLTVRECQPGGPLYDFHCWLDDYLQNDGESGFFRPYAVDTDSVAPEPWHLSYRPVSQVLQTACDFEFFLRLLSEDNLPLNHIIQNQAKEIFERYIAFC